MYACMYVCVYACMYVCDVLVRAVRGVHLEIIVGRLKVQVAQAAAVGRDPRPVCGIDPCARRLDVM